MYFYVYLINKFKTSTWIGRTTTQFNFEFQLQSLSGGGSWGRQCPVPLHLSVDAPQQSEHCESLQQRLLSELKNVLLYKMEKWILLGWMNLLFRISVWNLSHLGIFFLNFDIWLSYAAYVVPNSTSYHKPLLSLRTGRCRVSGARGKYSRQPRSSKSKLSVF